MARHLGHVLVSVSVSECVGTVDTIVLEYVVVVYVDCCCWCSAGQTIQFVCSLT
jgi:hypothetical protein